MSFAGVRLGYILRQRCCCDSQVPSPFWLSRASDPSMWDLVFYCFCPGFLQSINVYTGSCSCSLSWSELLLIIAGLEDQVGWPDMCQPGTSSVKKRQIPVCTWVRPNFYLFHLGNPDNYVLYVVKQHWT